MCSLDIFDNLQLVGRNLKGGLFDPQVLGDKGTQDQGWTHLISHPWVPISSPLTLAGSKSVSARPSSQDTLTNTAPEATA